MWPSGELPEETKATGSHTKEPKTNGDERRTGRAARSAGGNESMVQLKAPCVFPGALSCTVLSLPLAGRSAGDATGPLVDAPRQPPVPLR